MTGWSVGSASRGGTQPSSTAGWRSCRPGQASSWRASKRVRNSPLAGRSFFPYSHAASRIAQSNEGGTPSGVPVCTKELRLACTPEVYESAEVRSSSMAERASERATARERASEPRRRRSS
eukprot:426801-Prymnesium_polylepis.1